MDGRCLLSPRLALPPSLSLSLFSSLSVSLQEALKRFKTKDRSINARSDRATDRGPMDQDVPSSRPSMGMTIPGISVIGMAK